MINLLKYFIRNKKIGLALGSGGARGVAHIAVLDHLQDMSVPVDLIAGSSIGAVIGALYGMGRLDDFKDDLFKISKMDIVRLMDLSMNKSGLINGYKMINFIKKFIPASTRLEDLPIPLAVVATNATTGQPVVFTKGNLLYALRASMSIPGVYTPVPYQDTYLIDGGVADPLPVDIARTMGARFIIAVNLVPHVLFGERPALLAEAPDSMGPEWDQAIGHNLLSEAKEGIWDWVKSWHNKNISSDPGPSHPALPSIFDIFVRSLDIMTIQMLSAKLRSLKPTVLIEPDVDEISAFDFHKSQQTYDLGMGACRAAHDQLLKIKRWL
jgi:NTE family protein